VGYGLWVPMDEFGCGTRQLGADGFAVPPYCWFPGVMGC
jgi:hypothetical protein